ncbi:hypothetical protein MLD38_022977 [Melastoma candidum]|uniref:Uncharacterized protein n=1 Tax=Melastoma candidum TaxID=119954 RepID=A0ACB9QKY1_9MYRT|nr:hypothetical protein MLD38_022977 [Melastoma candidum]
MFKSILPVISFLIFSCKIASAVVNVTTLFTRCGPGLDIGVPSNQSAHFAISHVKGRLIDETPRRVGYKRYVRQRLEDNNLRSCYGLARCNRALAIQECRVCLGVADRILIQACGFARSGRIALQDCYMRFAMTYFYEGFRPQDEEEHAAVPDSTERSTEDDDPGS